MRCSRMANSVRTRAACGRPTRNVGHGLRAGADATHWVFGPELGCLRNLSRSGDVMEFSAASICLPHHNGVPK
jgi:hypothetical protein